MIRPRARARTASARFESAARQSPSTAPVVLVLTAADTQPDEHRHRDDVEENSALKHMVLDSVGSTSCSSSTVSATSSW